MNRIYCLLKLPYSQKYNTQTQPSAQRPNKQAPSNPSMQTEHRSSEKCHNATAEHTDMSQIPPIARCHSPPGPGHTHTQFAVRCMRWQHVRWKTGRPLIGRI